MNSKLILFGGGILACSFCLLVAPEIYGATGTGNLNSKIPKILTLKETGLGQVMQGTFTFAKGFQVPLITLTQNGKIIRLFNENFPEKSTFQLASYNPTLVFQFGKGSKLPLLNIKQLFVGKIKSYPNSTLALKSGSLFKRIGLNEDTVLKLEESGTSYMVVEVKFGKNISGLYSVTFDNTPYGDKSSDRMQLADELSGNSWKVANSTSVEIKPADSFMSVVRSVMCHTTQSYGFRVCKE
jgi:hypothetical protein